MEITALPFSQYRQVAWRNGGGTARDIAVHPAGAGMAETFGWRVALAEIAKDGPFSYYEPEIERVITLLDGAGFDLDFQVDFDGAPGLAVTEPHEPARFRGHWPAMCRLRQGRSIVFNILYDFSRFSAQPHIIRPVAEQPMMFSPPGRQSILFSLAGRFEIKADAPQDANNTTELAPWDSLQIDLSAGEAPLLSVTARSPESRLLLVGFDPVAP
ncbi:MAG TPA: HutD family protein [Dongiaceae bacterium]|nr:HutD family protein [Dongiaceae bacterium]